MIFNRKSEAGCVRAGWILDSVTFSGCTHKKTLKYSTELYAVRQTIELNLKHQSSNTYLRSA